MNPVQSDQAELGRGGLPIDPRLARRRAEVSEHQARRRRRRLVGLVATLGLLAAGWGSLYTPIWQVRHVRYQLPAGVSPATVLSLSGLSHHPLMVEVNAGLAERRLDAVPAFGAARVRVRWPDSVEVSLQERLAVAQAPTTGGGWAEIDPTGRVLAEQAAAYQGLPTLAGFEVAQAAGSWLKGSFGPRAAPDANPTALADLRASLGSPRAPRGLKAALVCLWALPAQVRSVVVSALVVPDGPPQLTIRVGPGSATASVYLADGSQLGSKLTSLVTLVDQADLKGVKRIDLSVPDRPALEVAQ